MMSIVLDLYSLNQWVSVGDLIHVFLINSQLSHQNAVCRSVSKSLRTVISQAFQCVLARVSLARLLKSKLLSKPQALESSSSYSNLAFTFSDNISCHQKDCREKKGSFYNHTESMGLRFFRASYFYIFPLQSTWSLTLRR